MQHPNHTITNGDNMIITEKTRCETCIFGEPNAMSDTGLVCRYYPPQTQAVYVGYGEWKTFTPENEVDPLDWCSKHEEKAQ